MIVVVLLGCVGEIPIDAVDDTPPVWIDCIDDWIGDWSVDDARCDGGGDPLTGWGDAGIAHHPDGCGLYLSREIDGCAVVEALTFDLSRSVIEVRSDGGAGCGDPLEALDLGAGDLYQSEPDRLAVDLTHPAWTTPECSGGLYLILRRD